MQSLIRSKSAGVTGGRGTAGAGPGRDLHYRVDLGSLLATNHLTLVVHDGPLKAHPKAVSRCVVKSTVYSTCSLPRLFVHDNVMKAIND